jgi:phosphatidyl-myo-inositol dimannoside synthase
MSQPAGPQSSAEILLVTELFPPAIGGSAVLLESVYSRMVETPVTVLADPVASGGRSGDMERFASKGDGHRVPRSVRLEWTRIDGAKRGLQSAGELAQHARVARAIRRHARARPTLVHCGRPLPEGLPALAARLFGAGPRYLCWVHGEEVTAALTSRELTWLVRRVCRRAEAIIANSAYTARIVHTLGVPTDRVHIVHPGVDAGRFTTNIDAAEIRRRLAPSADLLLLSVGRLQSRKGHDLVMRAIAALNDELPRLAYVIAGDGRERARLEALARSLGVAGHVNFLGKVADAELPGLYAASDIFLMPTRDDNQDIEGFGIVFLEAAAAGRPTIGGRNGGVPEAIEEGVTGLLVDGHDAGELARAIKTLAEAPQLRLMMGAAGRERVLRAFSWERAAKRVEGLHAALTRSAFGNAMGRPP